MPFSFRLTSKKSKNHKLDQQLTRTSNGKSMRRKNSFRTLTSRPKMELSQQDEILKSSPSSQHEEQNATLEQQKEQQVSVQSQKQRRQQQRDATQHLAKRLKLSNVVVGSAKLGAQWGFSYSYSPLAEEPMNGNTKTNILDEESHKSISSDKTNSIDYQSPVSRTLHGTSASKSSLNIRNVPRSSTQNQNQLNERDSWTTFESPQSPFLSKWDSSFDSQNIKARRETNMNDTPPLKSTKQRTFPLLSPSRSTASNAIVGKAASTLPAFECLLSVLDQPFEYWNDLNLLFKDQPWSPYQRNRLIQYLIHFLELKIGMDEYVPTRLLLPTPLVESAWKTLVLETELYRDVIHALQDFHGKQRTMIHYSVHQMKVLSNKERDDKLRRTQSLFSRYFKETMPISATAFASEEQDFDCPSSSSSNRRFTTVKMTSPTNTSRTGTCKRRSPLSVSNDHVSVNCGYNNPVAAQSQSSVHTLSPKTNITAMTSAESVSSVSSWNETNIHTRDTSFDSGILLGLEMMEL